MQMRFVLLFLVCTFVAGCSMNQGRVSVADCTRAETLTLKKAPGQGSVHALSITGSGAVQGKAEIQLILNGSVYKRHDLDGSVRFEWNGDWYSDEAEVRYLPHSVSTGSVTLTYGFRD